MGYFHNAGYFEVEGEDFRRVMRMEEEPGPELGQAPVLLPPYCEFVKWRRDFVPPRGGTLIGRSLEIARRQVERLPATNPFPRFKARFERDLDALVCKKLCFHDYAFANLRQFGACYELAATWLRWLSGHGIHSVEEPAAALQSIADGAKAFQFQLARAVNRGRALDTAPLDTMALQWDIAMEPLRKRLA